MKEEVPHRRNRRNDVNLEVRKQKRKPIRHIHLHHHHHAHLLAILMRVKIEGMLARKALIPELGWFLRSISTYAAYIQIECNALTLTLILTRKRHT